MKEAIVATGTTINDIVEQEIAKYGLDANLNHVDVSNVTNMRGMFAGSSFNGVISGWDVSKVTDTILLFFPTRLLTSCQ